MEFIKDVIKVLFLTFNSDKVSVKMMKNYKALYPLNVREKGPSLGIMTDVV